ncbi:HIT-like protein [Marasmius fiardii PR-910]|nr:HIT-like protein [Marasmius fiardii PR-910]
MTSFIINSHLDRLVPSSWETDSSCPFCRIIINESPSSRVFENEKVVAFLDIMPLRPGHTLVVPKFHCSRVSELPSEFAAAVGETISKIANALTKALDHTALNVVCNQEYAQAVPHVHYHIIPAPKLGVPKPETDTRTGATRSKVPPTEREMHRMEFESRDVLEEEDARDLVERIRAHL